jgi:hypothetical protein
MHARITGSQRECRGNLGKAFAPVHSSGGSIYGARTLGGIFTGFFARTVRAKVAAVVEAADVVLNDR